MRKLVDLRVLALREHFSFGQGRVGIHQSDA